MKKLDLHIHTKKTISDVNSFEFSMNRLKHYVCEMKLDAIAITNHNTFDLEQYLEIKKELNGQCEVFPGVEINVGNIGFGHLIIISEIDYVEEFAEFCKEVEERIRHKDDKLSSDDVKIIFEDLNKFLLIPHYDKDPNIEKDILVQLKDYILCGEVCSVKKFMYCQKNSTSLVPVLFSDYRPTDRDEIFPLRQTYFDVEELTISAIKKALLSKKHVSLTEEEGNALFSVLPELMVSTGLNVVIGERSSGKTYTLNEINKYQENIKYIKQFELIEPDPEAAAKEFAKKIKTKRSGIADDFLKEFANAVEDVRDISLENDEQQIEDYLSSLIKYAKEQDRVDNFAKCKLFSETKYTKRKLDNIDDLIGSIEKLISAREYREIIDKHVSIESLKALHKELVEKAIQEKQKALKEEWVNSLVKKVKSALKIRSSSNEVADLDLYEIQMNRKKIDIFSSLVEEIKKDSIIKEYEKGGFKVRIRKTKFNGAGELKNLSGKNNVHFSEIYEEYVSSPYKYLQGLISMTSIPESDYHKYFVNIEYEILNKYGAQISGGERAEFKLLNEIDDANRYDILLIDEPESSFDNLFLKDKVNALIKDISSNMPVILVTHNNTVGASIKPDYIIYTKRVIKNEEAIYERYCGLPSSKELMSYDGKKIRNFDVMLDCLEAGKTTYEERRRDYEVLDD